MNHENCPFSLDDKLILVTGASSGIGRQCAIACDFMGANVVLFGRDLVRLNETLHMMKNQRKHLVCPIDLLEFDKVSDKVMEVVETKGKINGLINCAGISTTLPLNAITSDKMQLFFQTNVFAGINLAKHVVRPSNFSEDGGSIVFISSVMGVTGEAGKALYSMTKSALIGAVKSLSIELARRKIRFNTISPGVVDTPMSKNATYSRNEESINKIIKLHPLGLGRPEDVANACIFLLSNASCWITGTNIVVDGGYLAR